MTARKTLLSTILAIGAMAVLGVGLYQYKQKQRDELANDRGPEKTAAPRILSEFQILDKTSVVNREEALGHTFFLLDSKGSRYKIYHYFVESPPTDLDDNTSPKLARLARYFGNVPLEKLIEIGVKAREFTLENLATRPFRIVTLFSPLKNQVGVYAYALIRDEKGDEHYLSELLVREGLAAVSAQGEYLPFGDTRTSYRNHLIKLEREARAEKRGVWAFSRSPDEGGAIEDPVVSPEPTE